MTVHSQSHSQSLHAGLSGELAAAAATEALRRAIDAGDAAGTAAALGHGADADAVWGENPSSPALVQAVAIGGASGRGMVRLLYQAGADGTLADEFGVTPWAATVKGEDLEMAALVLDHDSPQPLGDGTTVHTFLREPFVSEAMRQHVHRWLLEDDQAKFKKEEHEV